MNEHAPSHVETIPEPEVASWTPWPMALSGWLAFAAVAGLIYLLVRVTAH